MSTLQLTYPSHRSSNVKPLDWSELKVRSRGRLPHWEIPGMTVFVTYRLADALPKGVVEAYKEERRRLDRLTILDPHDAQIRKDRARLFCERIDRVLDGGTGSCALARGEIASMVLANLHHHDGALYLLHAAAIMPNHVHVMVTLQETVTLARVTHA